MKISDPLLLAGLRATLAALGAKSCHQDRLLRLWLAGQVLSTAPTRREHHLPAQLQNALGEVQGGLNRLAAIAEQHEADDGARRLLLRLADNQAIETVLLPRGGVCISSQVGCAVGCLFCMTGRGGLLRQLQASEMVAQLALARLHQPIRKVVFMGMGEPAHNLDQVIEAIQVIGGLGGLAHKNLVFSTVGDERVFERLPTLDVKPALALSLHTTNAQLREELLPRAPRIAPARLVSLAQTYAQLTGYPIQYQWTLLEGVNDTQAETSEIIRLLKGAYAVVNLIPFNAISGSSFRRPQAAVAKAMAQRLQAAGIVTRLRQSAGQDVDAGCGQLRARRLPNGLGQVHALQSGAIAPQ
jgi:23S rRNA (adenine2503-C2)-methyltransferase